jgi:hypothetical protein
MSKLLCNIVDEIWYNDLKNANTFYTKVTAINIMSLLNAISGELHALDMILLCTEMMQYYVQADGIPQFIAMMEDAPKKANWAGIPIADVELVMMALVAVLAAQHFPHEVNDWECPRVAHGKPGRWLSALLTSNVSANSKLKGMASTRRCPRGDPNCRANYSPHWRGSGKPCTCSVK